jgi:hypothetical protein
VYSLARVVVILVQGLDRGADGYIYGEFAGEKIQN